MKPTVKLTPLILSNWSRQGLVSNIFPKSGLSAASGRGLARGKHAGPVQHAAAARGWRGLTGVCQAKYTSSTQSPVPSLLYTPSPEGGNITIVISTRSIKMGYNFARNCLSFGVVRFVVLHFFLLEKNQFPQCPYGASMCSVVGDGFKEAI